MILPKLVVKATVVRHTNITSQVKQLVLQAPDIAEQTVPGQFVHIRVADCYEPLLRRPISISNVDRANGTIYLIYRVIGRGTQLLARLKPGDLLNCMGPLGNGFTLQGKRSLLVGGGMGLAPLVYLAATLCPNPVTVLMGGRTEQEMFWTGIFKSLCENLHITTDDGSLGQRGITLDLLPKLLKSKSFDMIYTCGPSRMMAGVANYAETYGIPCQVSLEEYMACGVGACLSCTCEATNGPRKKTCTEGPVFWSGEVVL